MAGTSCSFCTLRNTRSRTGTAGRMWGGRRVWKDGFAGREALAPRASPGALGWGFCFSPQQQLWAGGRHRNQDSREQPKSNPPCPFPRPDPGADRFCFGLGGCSTTSGKAEAESEEVFIQIFFCTTHGALKILNLMWFVGMWK